MVLYITTPCRIPRTCVVWSCHKLSKTGGVFKGEGVSLPLQNVRMPGSWSVPSTVRRKSSFVMRLGRVVPTYYLSDDWPDRKGTDGS